MIQCPYCTAEMADDAVSCPRCRSLLVESEEKTRVTTLPRFLHPASAVVLVVVLALGILAVSVARDPGRLKKWLSSRPSPALPGSPAGGTTPAASSAGQPIPPVPPPPEPNQQELYNRIVEYEKAVLQYLAQADALAREMDQLRASNDKKNVPAMTEKIAALGNLVSQVQALTPIPALQRTHTKLTNSFRLRQRGYREMSFYLQSGDITQLNAGQNSLRQAEKSRQEALEEIKAVKERYTPPPSPSPEPAPAPPGTVETPPPSTQPGATPSPPQPGTTAVKEEPSPHPYPGATAAPENGATVIPLPGESVSPPLPGATPEVTPSP